MSLLSKGNLKNLKQNLNYCAVTGLILSGGRSSRMGEQDKGLILLNGKPMIATVKQILSPQVDQILISANKNIEQYRQLNKIVLTDEHDDYRGPLAGIYEGLKYIKEYSFLLVVPCDGPLLPSDLSRRMLVAIENNSAAPEETNQQNFFKLATVFDGNYRQPSYSLIHQSLKDNLKVFLDQGGRKLGQWLSENNTQLVDFSDQQRAFVNINTQKDLAQLFK